MHCVHIRLPADRFSWIAPQRPALWQPARDHGQACRRIRRSEKSVASGHCRNVTNHRMDASGLIPRSGDHGDVAGSTGPVHGKRWAPADVGDVDGIALASRHDVEGVCGGASMFRCRLSQGENNKKSELGMRRYQGCTVPAGERAGINVIT